MDKTLGLADNRSMAKRIAINAGRYLVSQIPIVGALIWAGGWGAIKERPLRTVSIVIVGQAPFVGTLLAATVAHRWS